MVNPDEFIIIDLNKTMFSWLVFKYQRDIHHLDIAGECDCAVIHLTAAIAQRFGGGEFVAVAYPLGKVSSPNPQPVKLVPVQALYIFIHAGAVAFKPLPRQIVRALATGESIGPLLLYLLFIDSPKSEQERIKGAPRNAIYDEVEKAIKEGMKLRQALSEADPNFAALSPLGQSDAVRNARAALRERSKRRVKQIKPAKQKKRPT